MRGYLVTGRGFHVGSGALILIAAAAAAERAHKLDQVGGTDGFMLARAKETQAFKVGELIGLEHEPKGQGGIVEELTGKPEKDSPAALLVDAIRLMETAARQAERKANSEREAAEKERALKQRKEAEEAQVALWTEEWKATEAARKQYPKVDDYLAARRKEMAVSEGSSGGGAAS